jgi:OmpA-OmpF porin, OOP family
MNHKLRFAILIVALLFQTIKAQDTLSGAKRTIIYADNFSNDVIGKFPAKWTSNTPGEVVSSKKYPGKWLKMHSEGTYLPQINQVLPKEFTITFDFIFQPAPQGYNTTELTLFGNPDSLPVDALFPGNFGLRINLEDYIVSYTCYNNRANGAKISGENRTSVTRENERARIAIKVHQQTMQLFVNETELLSTPICSLENLDSIRFHLWGSQAEPLIGNFRVITGE